MEINVWFKIKLFVATGEENDILVSDIKPLLGHKSTIN